MPVSGPAGAALNIAAHLPPKLIATKHCSHFMTSARATRPDGSPILPWKPAAVTNAGQLLTSALRPPHAPFNSAVMSTYTALPPALHAPNAFTGTPRRFPPSPSSPSSHPPGSPGSQKVPLPPPPLPPILSLSSSFLLIRLLSPAFSELGA
jgi:hypothetical protein